MKQLPKSFILSGISTIAGVLALFLQLWFLSRIDEKGLLATAHPSNILSGIITAAVVLFLIFFTQKHQEICQFPATPVTAAGMLATTVGIAAAVWSLLTGTASILALVTGIVGIFAGLCTTYIALLRVCKRRAHPLLYCPGIVFFMLMLICMYQQWSGEPELSRYFYPLLALVFLMLSTYQRAALKVGMEKSCAYLFFSRAALFFCLAAIPASYMQLLYGAMALSIILDGCTIHPTHSQGE